MPAGHGVGALEPAAQKKPLGHTAAVVLVAPAGQKEPAAHWFAVPEVLPVAKQ